MESETMNASNDVLSLETILVEQTAGIDRQSLMFSAIMNVHSDADDPLEQQNHETSSESAGTANKDHLITEQGKLSLDDIKSDETPDTALENERADGSDDMKQDGIKQDNNETKEVDNKSKQEKEEKTKQDGLEDQSSTAETVKLDKDEDEETSELGLERLLNDASTCEAQEEMSTAPKTETGAAFLRHICDGTRSISDDDDAAKFLHTIYKSANRVGLLDKLRESECAMESFEATWKYTQNPTVFEKRALRFINILRMQSSRLDPRKEHLNFWISHLDETGIPAYFTHLILYSSPSNRVALTYGWLLSELLKLDESGNARFYKQCSKEPKIASLLQDHSNDENVEHLTDTLMASNQCEDIADFEDPSLGKTEVYWRKKKLLNSDAWESSDLIEIMDDLMALTGLESVKRFFMDTIDQYELIAKHSMKKRQVLNTTFTGNPGVGKTRVAKLYSRLLVCLMELSEKSHLKEESGHELYFEDYKDVIKRTGNLNKGVIMIDEAPQLNQGSSRRPLILVSNMEKKRGAVHYVLTGLTDSMESLRATSIRFQSLIPHNINIDDHTLSEAFALLKEEIKTTWDDKMKIEGGISGLFVRIAARRLSKGRGYKGYSNFHGIERLMANIRRRHASRIAIAKDCGQTDIDDMLLTKEDLLGPPPDESVKSCEAWKTLHEMTGLQKVKRAVQSLVERVNLNYQRELDELPTLDTNLNRLFLGNPGTGKTTVAKLYAEIMARSGVLSSSEVILKTPIDFTSEYIGETATKTKELLTMARGKVLVIDEAYMMYPEGDGRIHSIHSSAIDAIVSDVQGVAGEDRAVLLLGYRDKMEHMLQKGNPGLERRFPLSTAFIFEDYTQPELLKIFHKKMQKQGLSCTAEAVGVAMDLLDKARRRPNFGNAGEVDNVLSKAKQQASLRLHDIPLEARPIKLVLQPEDFDTEHKRTDTATANIASLFQNVLECEHLVTKLQGYATTCQNLRMMGMQPTELIPFSFVFKGPPGTFKTSAARAFGKVFYDMGLLADSSVVDCSSTDLVAEYCGQTGVKTRQVLDQAIGKVLLIDEAYRLVETSKFGEEAIGELIDAMTKPRYMQKMVIILAGDEEKMNQFMLKYHHLRSRFAEDIMFKSLGVEQSYKLLMRSVSSGNKLPIEVGTDIAHWEKPCKKSLRELVNLPTWGNGRDVTEILAKRLIGRVISRPLQVTNGQKPRLVCQGQDFYAELQKLCIERRTLMA